MHQMFDAILASHGYVQNDDQMDQYLLFVNHPFFDAEPTFDHLILLVLVVLLSQTFLRSYDTSPFYNANDKPKKQVEKYCDLKFCTNLSINYLIFKSLLETRLTNAQLFDNALPD